TCRHCHKTKPIHAFYENKFSPDGRYAFCKVCFDQFAQKLKEKRQQKEQQQSAALLAEKERRRSSDTQAAIKRTCNGCNKTEIVTLTDAKTAAPVHAWFCDICMERGTRRIVRKDAIVKDFSGLEYKITKIINPEFVLGVGKTKEGRWSRKPVKIYGNWTTGKEIRETRVKL
ncbi:MAG: hypothetical protein Q7U02_03910, partial [Desulfosalsimonadaceae bacterium]|nr:hypothetical protein [Desulfosalsimonadaceae bacterium]